MKPNRRNLAVIPNNLRPILSIVLMLFALLFINSGYLISITLLESQSQNNYQDYWYQMMFLLHLLLGLLLIIPSIWFISRHLPRAWQHPNRRAVKAGLGLLVASLLLLLSGLILTRFDFLDPQHQLPQIRHASYWLHIITPLLCVWLFTLHRLAGRRLQWRFGIAMLVMTLVISATMVGFYRHTSEPMRVAQSNQLFTPSFIRTANNQLISSDKLVNDDYCKSCHQDIHQQWLYSAHKFSSFNNPAYLFSIQQTEQALIKRDGHANAIKFCAGCHDPVPLLEGQFDNPDFDKATHPTGQAGITCTVCHSITAINSPKGNADFTITAPKHYPFATSDKQWLQWLNHQLIKAKPEFHKQTFLKPVHQSPEFCGSCHKVHLPQALNDYKWLRGQNHYDSYHLSGVSGHGVSSFYYPPKAEDNCNGCHMPLLVSDDFGAIFDKTDQQLKVHDHQFPSANTAIPHLLKYPDWVNQNHKKFLQNIVRVDLFGIREQGTIDGKLIAPLRPQHPILQAGKTYLLEAVIRTLKLGHLLTEGTADSNQIWLEVMIKSGDKILAHNGNVDPEQGRVDPWAHFVNAYVLDRQGKRIDRRNAEDIFVPLYNHQIPPGATDVVHYQFTVPDTVNTPITITAKLHYRKFDTTYLQYIQADKFKSNDLPIMTLAEDSMTFATTAEQSITNPAVKFAQWQRWNDYGIGLLRKPQKRQLAQAEQAFKQVEHLGYALGSVNLARVYLAEGRLEEAIQALAQAQQQPNPAYPWVMTWLTGLINKQYGYFEQAIANFKTIINNQFADIKAKGFDFSQDYRVLNELGQTLLERAKQLRGEAKRPWLEQAKYYLDQVLRYDPENATAHYNLMLTYQQLEQPEQAKIHQQYYQKYRVDNNARDFAITEHRRHNAVANYVAEPVVIYPLK